MTKAKTKAERQRAKRQRARQITLTGAETRDRAATRGPRHTEPPDQVALTARARRTGCTVEEARDVLAGEDMGRCIRFMRPGGEDRRDLMGVWQGITASWHNYATRCLSLTPTPQAAALPMLSDPMQTDQSLRVDLRTSDERDEAALRVWFEWLARLMDLPADQRHALRGHLQDYGAPVWDADARRPTRHGALAVKALAALHARNA
jgi:hypothetical protein